MTLSYSSIKLYSACPLAYKFSKIDKIHTLPNRYMIIGSLVHEAAEKGFDDERFIDVSLKYGNEIADEVKSIIDFAKDMFVHAGNPEVRLAIDKDKKQVDFDDPNAIFRGIIDRLVIEDDQATIIDYKTNHVASSDPLQLRFYAFLVYHIFHPNQITVEFRYLRLKRVYTQTFSELELETTDQDVWNTILHYAELIKYDMQNGFKPNPGVACTSCPYSGMCDTFKEFKEHTFGIIPSTPDEIANAIIVEKTLDTQKRLIHDQVKKYVSVFGELNTLKVKAYFSKVRQERVKLNELIEYVKDNNVDLAGITIPAAKLSKKIPEGDLKNMVETQLISKINTKVVKQ